MVFAQNNIICESVSVLAPSTNIGQPLPKILPERFNSTSEPSKVSVVSTELSSVSEPKLSHQ